MSFLDSLLDSLLAADPSLQAQLDEDSADAAAGITYGIYRDGLLIDTAPSRWQAAYVADDNADAMDVPRSHFRIEPLDVLEVAA